MDLSLQSKMLRFLQTKQVQRLGEDRLRASDVRIVCATNRNPQAEVAETTAKIGAILRALTEAP